jgi:hypothetical protein
MIRRKNYGIECRTLSSYFTQKNYLPWVWDQLFKLEEFVNQCDPYDLALISRDQHYVGTTENSIVRIFNTIFNRFKNKKILTNFEETNEILQLQTDKYHPSYSSSSPRYYYSDDNTSTF